MAKTTVTLRDATGGARTMAAEQLPGATHLIQHVATALRTIIGYGFAAVTTVVGLPNIPAGATHAYLTVETGGGDLRWRSDGGTPIATPTLATNSGLRAPAGSAVEIALVDLTQVKLVAVSGTATVCVEYAKLDA
jgi:hypothetical protein